MGTVVSCQDYVDFFTAQAIVLELIIFLAILVACIPYFINQKWPCNNPCLIRCRVLHGSSQSPPKTWIRCLIRWIQCITDAIVEIAFGRILKKHSNQEERNVYNVLKYKAPPNYTNILFLTLIYLIVSVLAQFWDDFLLQESFECTTDRSTCCFGYNQNFQFLPLDCSNTTYLKNITSIICYKFVFELGTATGSSLGIFTSSVVSLSVITWCLLKVSKGTKTTVCRAVFTITLKFYASLAVLAATIFMITYKVDSYHGSKFGLALKITEIYLIGGVLFWYIIIFPWRKFEKILKHKNTNSTILFNKL